MKNSKNNFRILFVALAVLFTTLSTAAAHAASSTGTNERVEKYIITITDSDKTIYTETIKGKGLVRKFQFVNNGSEEDVLHVEIKNLSTNKVITYKINPATNVEVETELVASL